MKYSEEKIIKLDISRILVNMTSSDISIVSMIKDCNIYIEILNRMK